MGFRGPFRRKGQANGRPPEDNSDNSNRPPVVEPTAVFSPGEGSHQEPPRQAQPPSKPRFYKRHPVIFSLIAGFVVLAVGPAACRAAWHVGDPVTYGGAPGDPDKVLLNGQSSSPEKDAALNDLKDIARISCTGYSAVEAFKGISSEETTNPPLMDALKNDRTSYRNYKEINEAAINAINAIEGSSYYQPDCQLGIGGLDVIEKYETFINSQLPQIKPALQNVSSILKSHPSTIQARNKNEILGKLSEIPSKVDTTRKTIKTIYASHANQLSYS